MAAGEFNPYHAPETPLQVEDNRPLSLRVAAWRGAKTGAKWVTYVPGPVCLFAYLAGLGRAVYFIVYRGDLLGVVAEPFEALKRVGSPVGVFLLLLAYGFVIGGIVGGAIYTARGIADYFSRKSPKPSA